MERVNGRRPATDDGGPEAPVTRAARAARPTETIGGDTRSLGFPTTTVDETVLEGRYRSALAAWKEAVKSAHPTDPRDRQRVALLQRAYLEALSALEEARAEGLRGGRHSQIHETHHTAAQNAQMLLRQHEARSSATDEARHRRGLLARIFRRD